jgi:hypothetical protein
MLDVKSSYRYSELKVMDLEFLQANGYEVMLDGDAQIAYVRKLETFRK